MKHLVTAIIITFSSLAHADYYDDAKKFCLDNYEKKYNKELAIMGQGGFKVVDHKVISTFNGYAGGKEFLTTKIAYRAQHESEMGKHMFQPARMVELKCNMKGEILGGKILKDKSI